MLITICLFSGLPTMCCGFVANYPEMFGAFRGGFFDKILALTNARSVRCALKLESSMRVYLNTNSMNILLAVVWCDLWEMVMA